MAGKPKAINRGDLTGGSLLIRESRLVASMLVEGWSPQDIKAQVLGKNLFQNDSPSTTRRYCRLILSRLRCLSMPQLRLLGEGNDETAGLLLLTAVLKTYPIVRSFVREVLLEKVRCYEPKLERKDWVRFLEQWETIDPEVPQWTESSRKKMGQVIIRMLSEAGILSDTRTMTIQFPIIPPEVTDVLIQASEDHILEYLRLGKAACHDIR